MKLLLTTLSITFLFIGCRKSDIHFIRGKFVKCDVAEQSPNIVGYLVGKGFKKTYYNEGLVESVTTTMNSAFVAYDSIIYNFTYSHNRANVIANRWFFTITGDGEGGYIIILDPDRPPVQYNFTVEFDAKSFNAIQAGTTTFKYDKQGRLTGYDDFAILYDTKGNIIQIDREVGGRIEFKYDYTRTAKQQLYYTTGFMTNEMYNLMEIMGWIPVEPNNLRISHTLFPEPDFNFGTFYFFDHTIDKDGKLTSFRESFSEEGPDPYPAIVNTWNCQPIKKSLNTTK